MSLCVKWTHSAKAATIRRRNTLLSSILSRHVCSLLAAERKRCVRLSREGESFRGSVFLGRKESPSFQANADFASCQRFPGEIITFVFIYVFYTILFFFFLIPEAGDLEPASIYLFRSLIPPIILFRKSNDFNFFSSKQSIISRSCPTFLSTSVQLQIFFLFLLICIYIIFGITSLLKEI